MLPVFKKRKPREGLLGKFDLWDWWETTFTEEQKAYILEKYQPMGLNPGGKSILTDGNASISSPRSFLSGVAMWFNNPEGVSIAIEFMNKAQSYSSDNLDWEAYHFDCHERIKFYYRWRDEFEGALDLAISACREQIEVASITANKFATTPKWGIVPHHTGYEQLAIILEKQGKFEEAISLCEIGQAQGWSNDFDKRLVRLKKKLASARK